MTNVDPKPSPTGPAEVQPPSQRVRLLMSWKLWLALLVLGLIGIGISISLPIVHRVRALRYFDRHGVGANWLYSAGYELSLEHDDWPGKYGRWVNALHDIDSVYDTTATDESIRQACSSGPPHPVTES